MESAFLWLVMAALALVALAVTAVLFIYGVGSMFLAAALAPLAIWFAEKRPFAWIGIFIWASASYLAWLYAMHDASNRDTTLPGTIVMAVGISGFVAFPIAVYATKFLREKFESYQKYGFGRKCCRPEIDHES